jgi:sulfane dehydrogenase subunit SoxC
MEKRRFHPVSKNLGGKMKKISEIFKKDLTTTAEMPTSRREFFKKTAVYSVGAVAAANVLSPMSLKADDHAIIGEAPWGTKLGDLVTKNPYGLPSPFEHNNVRRTTDLLSSGDMYASVSMCPIHESDGIITPNGLFFTRNHGGTAHVDPNEFRLMIHGKVKREFVIT